MLLTHSLLIVGSKFTVFALLFEGNFLSTSPWGRLYLEGRFNGGFLRYGFGGLLFGGAYFRNFTVFRLKRLEFLQIFCIWIGIAFFRAFL